MDDIKNQKMVEEYIDLLKERRKQGDFEWVSRSMDILAPHNIPPEISFNYKQMIEATLANPRVTTLIKELSVQRHIPESKLISEALKMLQEMASKAHLPTVRWLGLVVTKVLKRILISIKVNESYLMGLKRQMSISHVQYVYAPTHRSYLDFVLLSYVLFNYDMALPNIASGMDFYKMKIVGELLRNTGAFYMRRTFAADPIYKELFKAYINTIVTHSNRALEFFIEGTRSRSQKSLAPKFGLLSTILDGYFRSNVPDIQFVPIVISYDKPLEELLFTYELLGVPKPAESTSGLFRSLSVLREPHGYGNVHMRFCEPISARDYIHMSIRKTSALSLNAKLPYKIIKKIAYDIVDCHKRNTILTPINLIALLYNEKMHSKTTSMYGLDDLFIDYSWIKRILTEDFKATVNPLVSNTCMNHPSEDLQKSEILEAINIHGNLMKIDSEENLSLLQRHSGVIQVSRIKGYPLSEETLKIAVPVVNLMIYVNPTLAYLTKPALVALSIKTTENTGDDAFKRYVILRSVLSNEFALATNLSESVLRREWSDLLNTLGTNLNNEKLINLLCNLLTPYLASAYVLCSTLLQWDDYHDLTEAQLLKECQKFVEESLHTSSSFIKHPYSLTLDTYSSTLVSLITQNVILVEKAEIVSIDKASLNKIIFDITSILKKCATASYVNFAFLTENANISSKL